MRCCGRGLEGETHSGGQRPYLLTSGNHDSLPFTFCASQTIAVELCTAYHFAVWPTGPWLDELHHVGSYLPYLTFTSTPALVHNARQFCCHP